MSSSQSMFRLQDITPAQQDVLYAIFVKSYTEATGKSWSRAMFNSRARQWTFFGLVTGSPETSGVVAVREQMSGLVKLTAVAGHPRAVMRGIRDLNTIWKDRPIWGAVSADLVPVAQRYGMIAPHSKIGGPLVIRMVAKQIPPEVFGGASLTVRKDGGIDIDVPEIGVTTKYLVGNRAYFKDVAKHPAVESIGVPAWLLAPL